VQHDVRRPFVVRAGAGEARVLGTAFDVDLTRRRVALSVYRGAVGFEASGRAAGVVVRAGYRSTLRGGTVAAPAPFDATSSDWRQGWIDTRGMRIDDLVDALGRQSDVAIVPPTGRLAAITVVGRFRADQPRTLLRAIGDEFGFVVVDTPEGLVLKPAS
jgi:transmembrane sensor